MRIGHWKSGWVGLDLTDEEMEKLGGVGTPISIVAIWPTSQKARDKQGPKFVVVAKHDGMPADQRCGNIHIKKKIGQALPQYTHYVQINISKESSLKDVPHFAFMEATTDWLPKMKVYHLIVDNWANRKATGTSFGKRGKPAGSSALGNGLSSVIGNQKATVSNMLAPKIAQLLDRLNYIAGRNPGRVQFFVDDKDGKLKAAVSSAEVVG